MNISPLRILRSLRGWSQSEFAERLGIDRSILSRVETGFVKPGPELRRRIAEALQASEEVIFANNKGADI